MKRTTLAALLALPAIIGVSAVAYSANVGPAMLDGVNVGDTMGTAQEAIGAKLTALGYTMTEFENDEDGYIEVELVAGDHMFELEIDMQDGSVLEIEPDDADDGENDD